MCTWSVGVTRIAQSDKILEGTTLCICISKSCAGWELNKTFFKNVQIWHSHTKKLVALTVYLFDFKKVSTAWTCDWESAHWNEMQTSFALQWESEWILREYQSAFAIYCTINALFHQNYCSNWSNINSAVWMCMNDWLFHCHGIFLEVILPGSNFNFAWSCLNHIESPYCNFIMFRDKGRVYLGAKLFVLQLCLRPKKNCVACACHVWNKFVACWSKQHNN